MTPNNNLQNRIKHVFVVMLENRAFDHMLGLSHIQGIDAVSGPLPGQTVSQLGVRVQGDHAGPGQSQSRSGHQLLDQ